jgi:RNA polymerase sigma-70 factor (ECF subfamily)
VSDTEDRIDVRRVLAGERNAFEGPVRRWRAALINLAYRYSRNRGEAEEMAQEAFMHAYSKLANYREEAPFGAWLLAVARRQYVSHLRRTASRAIRAESIDRLAERLPAGPDVAAERGRAELVRQAVTTLPGRYRDAVVLYYFHEQDVAAASNTLGIAVGTLKARLHRGRALLRRRFPALGIES